MDSKPTGNLESKSIPTQKILKGIFDAVGTLSEKGERRIAGQMLLKDYLPPSASNWDWDNLINIFVSQVTEKGKQEDLKMSDRTVFLSFRGNEIESISYRLYRENNGYRIEKQEDFKREKQKSPESRFPSVDWYLKMQERRSLGDLEKNLGYASVDASEAQELLDLLNKLVEQRTR